MASLTLQPAAPSLRLTRRGRLTITVLVLLAIAVLSVIRVAPALGQGRPESLRHVVVQPGDSLWSIARAANPAADPRDTIAALRELNGLDESDRLVAGRSLTLPPRG